jgi:RNA polymerase I-specific transcription initiation factor RRN3
VVAVCCQWLEEKLGDLQLIVNGSSQGDTDTDLLSDISVFYAICQAIFLVFCFRWRDLLGVNDDDEHPEDNESGDEDADERSSKKWMNELSIVQRLIISPLNPLKVSADLFYIVRTF